MILIISQEDFLCLNMEENINELNYVSVFNGGISLTANLKRLGTKVEIT